MAGSNRRPLELQVSADRAAIHVHARLLRRLGKCQSPEQNAAGLRYDRNGNLKEEWTEMGYDNRLLQNNAWKFTYDAEGNRIEQQKVSFTPGSNDRPPLADNWTYAYDVAGRIIRVDKRERVETAGQVTYNDLENTTYRYDAEGNRVESRHTNETTNNVSSERYVNVGGQVWTETGSGNLPWRSYLLGDQPDQLLARYSGVGALWYSTDIRGSVVSMFDNQGTIGERRKYDGFGKIVQREPAWAGALTVDTYGYTGRDFDKVANLQYNRARQYDPETGRWINPDPLGFGAGDSNLYRYVGNNPANARDPSGLVWGWGFAVGGAVISSLSYLAGTAITGAVTGQNHFSWGGLVGAAAGGAAAGLVLGAVTGDATSALGLVGAGALAGAYGGFVGGFVGNAVDQTIRNAQQFGWNIGDWRYDKKELLRNTLVGTLGGAIGGAVTGGLMGPAILRGLNPAAVTRVFASGGAGGVLGGGSAGALDAALQGQDPLEGFRRGALFGGIGGLVGAGTFYVGARGYSLWQNKATIARAVQNRFGLVMNDAPEPIVSTRANSRIPLPVVEEPLVLSPAGTARQSARGFVLVGEATSSWRAPNGRVFTTQAEYIAHMRHRHSSMRGSARGRAAHSDEAIREALFEPSDPNLRLLEGPRVFRPDAVRNIHGDPHFFERKTGGYLGASFRNNIYPAVIHAGRRGIPFTLELQGSAQISHPLRRLILQIQRRFGGEIREPRPTGSPLRLAASAKETAANDHPALSEVDLKHLMQEAGRRWALAGRADVKRLLDQVVIRITDLPDSYLGLANRNTIWIDQDASGYGWFVDTTAWEDSEFTVVVGDHELRAGETSAAKGHVDLLTVLMHEVGHLLGLAHGAEHEAMGETLTLGARHPLGSQKDAVFAGFSTTEDYNRSGSLVREDQESSSARLKNAQLVDLAFALFPELTGQQDETSYGLASLVRWDLGTALRTIPYRTAPMTLAQAKSADPDAAVLIGGNGDDLAIGGEGLDILIGGFDMSEVLLERLE